MKNTNIIFEGTVSPQDEIKDYTTLIERYPNTKELYESRAMAYITAGEYKNALSDFQKALGFDSKNTHYLFCCADCFEKLKEWDKALKEYRKIIAINRNEHLAYSAIAEILAMQGKNKEAESFYNQAVSIKTDITNLFFRGYFYMRTKQYEKALVDFENILKIAPNDKNAAFLKRKAKLKFF